MSELDFEGNLKSVQVEQKLAVGEYVRGVDDPREGREGDQLLLHYAFVEENFGVSTINFGHIDSDNRRERVSIKSLFELKGNLFVGGSLIEVRIYKLTQEKECVYFECKKVESIPYIMSFSRIGENRFCVQERGSRKLIVFQVD